MKNTIALSLCRGERLLSRPVSVGERQPLHLIGLLTLLLLLFSAGCQSTGSGASSSLFPQQRMEVDSTGDSNTGGRIGLFLNLKSPVNMGVRMDVSKIEILNDALWLPITSQHLEIDAAKLNHGQLFLGRGLLPAGHYQRLRFTLQQASISKEDGSRVFLALNSLSFEPAVTADHRPEARRQPFPLYHLG